MKIGDFEFLLGADPELFVKDPKGQFVSAHGMIPGTKSEPHKVEGGMVQVDGMAVEFGIDPAENSKEFISNIVKVMKTLAGMIPKGHTLSASPIAKFSPEIMQAQPPEALELGCEPDYNCYTLEKNPRPTAPADIRSAGGHVHIGWCRNVDFTDSDFIKECAVLVSELDYELGVASLGWDNDDLRRSIYGKAGCFRPKPYGLEYRTLSCSWVRSEELMKIVYDRTIKAISNVVLNKSKYKPLQARSFYRGKVVLKADKIINENWSFIGKDLIKNVSI